MKHWWAVLVGGEPVALFPLWMQASDYAVAQQLPLDARIAQISFEVLALDQQSDNVSTETTR